MLADQLYSLFLQHNKDHAFMFMDPQGRVTAWQGAAEEILGWRAEEVMGLPLTAIFTPEDQVRGFDQYELEVAKLNSRSEDDRWHVRKDGTRIWVTGTVNAIRNDAGELLGFVKVLRDRTDLRGQIDTLEREAQGLQDSRQRTHLFLRTLGHELRNPLGPLAAATFLIGKLSTESKIKEALQIISRQVAALTRLADDLMDITRLESGKVELNLVKVDLRIILRDAVASMQKLATDRKLGLTAVLPSSPLEVGLDEDRFQRLVLNLIGNAIKYTQPGGKIWVKATVEGADVVMRIEDTGIGIAPDMLPRIFELFTQERAASEMAPGGLGVGLAMVREIAELHGGSVQARSAGVGKGAEFTVRLPSLLPSS